MPDSERDHLLTADQMATFVTQGFLQLDAVVPADRNAQVATDQRADPRAGYAFWSKSAAVRAAFDVPAVAGALTSLVGPTAEYDHSYLHMVPAHHEKAQNWHVDSMIDTRPMAFDVLAFYFSHDTPRAMGPTLVLPGSHLRKAHSFSLSRYKNFAGQQQLAARAGTVVLMHHALWHCAQPNYTDETRYVFKLRLRPQQEQRNLFNTDGYGAPEIARRFNDAVQPWQGNERRLDQLHHALLWRYVTGDDHVDVSFEKSLTRMAATA